MVEHVGLREVGLLRLRRFIFVGSERADINQPGNAIVGTGAGDDASAVGVADEDNGAANPADRSFHQSDILCRCVEAVLRCNTLITLRLKWSDQLAEARAIGPEPMTENDAWFGFCRLRFHILSFFDFNYMGCAPHRHMLTTPPAVHRAPRATESRIRLPV